MILILLPKYRPDGAMVHDVDLATKISPRWVFEVGFRFGYQSIALTGLPDREKEVATSWRKFGSDYKGGNPQRHRCDILVEIAKPKSVAA